MDSFKKYLRPFSAGKIYQSTAFEVPNIVLIPLNGEM